MEEQKTNVDELIERMPEGYEQACFDTKAIERKREIKNPASLMKLILLYLTGGYSQIEMSVIAQELGIANISDVAFLKRFAKCKNWIIWIITRIIPKPIIEYEMPKWLQNYKLVALDASDVTEKGRSGRLFRLHYAFNIIKMCSLAYKITSQKVGETLLNFDIQKDWLILADRMYGTLTGIEYCLKKGANFILRLKYNAFKLYDSGGNEIDILDKMRDITSAVAKDIEVYVKLSKLGLTRLRICAVKIPDDKLDQVERRNKRRDSKKQKATSPEALAMSKYVVIITALPSIITADEIIALYRFRWQVEIYFKRLKSIMDFGNVPLKREDSIYTWLNGKLLVALLIEQMISEISIPPETSTKRSIWREVQIIYRMIRENVLSLSKLLDHFANISLVLNVEKRQRRRELQLA